MYFYAHSQKKKKKYSAFCNINIYSDTHWRQTCKNKCMFVCGGKFIHFNTDFFFAYLEDKTYQSFWSLLNNLIIISKWSSTIYKIKFFRFCFWDRCCVPCILMYSNINIFFTYEITEIISANVNKCCLLKKCWPKRSLPLEPSTSAYADCFQSK